MSNLTESKYPEIQAILLAVGTVVTADPSSPFEEWLDERTGELWIQVRDEYGIVTRKYNTRFIIEVMYFMPRQRMVQGAGVMPSRIQ